MLFNIAHRLLSIVNGPRLSIFIFHRVLAKHDPLMPGEPSVEEFDAIVNWIKKDFRIYPLGEALKRFQHEPEGKPLAAITFDDGYADNFQHALPILQKHSQSATFFIASGYLDGGCMWNDKIIESVRHASYELNLTEIGLKRYLINTFDDKVRCIENLLSSTKYLVPNQREALASSIAELTNTPPPSNLMMTTSELIALENAGMEIGAHTRTHPILAKLSVEEAKKDIGSGREDLEGKLKHRIEIFAYPNGKRGTDYTDDHIQLVRALGFKASVSTNHGSANRSTDVFQLPRFTPWQRHIFPFRLSSLKNTFANEISQGNSA